MANELLRFNRHGNTTAAWLFRIAVVIYFTVINSQISETIYGRLVITTTDFTSHVFRRLMFFFHGFREASHFIEMRDSSASNESEKTNRTEREIAKSEAINTIKT